MDFLRKFYKKRDYKEEQQDLFLKYQERLHQVCMKECNEIWCEDGDGDILYDCLNCCDNIMKK